MSTSLPSTRDLLAQLSLVLPVLLEPPLSNDRVKKLLLDQLGAIHLQPIPDSAQPSYEREGRSFSTSGLTNISQIQELFNNPNKFLHQTCITVTEFILLHDILSIPLRCHRTSPNLLYPDTSHSHPRLTTAEQLLLWIWYAVGSPVVILEEVFIMLDYSTILRYVDHVTGRITERMKHLVYWPDAVERRSLYNCLSLAEKAVAILDGTHCPVRKPSLNPKQYWSGHKHKYTQNYLIAVNYLGIVIYCDGPYPGHENDRGVYNQCKLAINPHHYLSENELVIADGGFFGGPHLICPIDITLIRSAANEDDKNWMIEFNRELKENRILVEDVLGWLKSRARVLEQKYARKKEKQYASSLLF